MESAQLSKNFGCIVEIYGAEADSKALVLRRRCAKRSMEQKWVSLLRVCAHMRVLQELRP